MQVVLEGQKACTSVKVSPSIWLKELFWFYYYFYNGSLTKYISIGKTCSARSLQWINNPEGMM